MDDDSTDKTRARAYAIWDAEGRPEGQHDDHWRRAQEQMEEARDPLTAAILPQASLLQSDDVEEETRSTSGKRARRG